MKYKSFASLLGAKYGYRFMPVNRSHRKSQSERNGIKRMKKHVRNKGKLNSKRIILLQSLDEKKVMQLAENMNRKMADYGIE